MLGRMALTMLAMSLGLAAARPIAAQLDPQAARADSLAARLDSALAAGDSLRGVIAALQAPPSPAGPVSPWRGALGLGYTLHRGNIDETSFITTMQVNRIGDRSRFTNNFSFNYIRLEDSPGANRGSFGSKFELNRSERFFYFASLDLNRNEQAGLNLRSAPGLGVGFSLVKQPRARLNLNLGANPVTEWRETVETTTTGNLLAIEDLGIELNDRVSLTQSLSYKPRFDRLEAYLVNFLLSLSNRLTTNFDLKLNLNWDYQSRPPAQLPVLERSEWMFYTSLNYKLW